jgi:hypothetical protein
MATIPAKIAHTGTVRVKHCTTEEQTHFHMAGTTRHTHVMTGAHPPKYHVHTPAIVIRLIPTMIPAMILSPIDHF